jgi:hypothetical protein
MASDSKCSTAPDDAGTAGHRAARGFARARLCRRHHWRASQRRCRFPRFCGANGGKLASSFARPGRFRPQLRSAIRCRQRIPLTSTCSTPSVSFCPNRARPGRHASQTNASGERTAAMTSRNACVCGASTRRYSVRAEPAREAPAAGRGRSRRSATDRRSHVIARAGFAAQGAWPERPAPA